MSSPPLAPTAVMTQYPYDADGHSIRINSDRLVQLMKEPEWKDATMLTAAMEYMRRAAAERGDDTPEINSDDSMHCRIELRNAPIEKHHEALMRLQSLAPEEQFVSTGKATPQPTADFIYVSATDCANRGADSFASMTERLHEIGDRVLGTEK